VKSFWENFLKIVIGLILMYFVFLGGISYKQFVNGGAKIVEKIKG